MTFLFDPSRTLIYVAVAIFIAAVASLLFSRRNPARKAIGIVVAAVIVAVLLGRYRTGELSVDDAGIAADTYGNPNVQWPDVEQAVYVPDLRASKYLPVPTLKTSLRVLGYGNARYGWFELGNGERALVAVRQAHGAAVVLVAHDAIYIFGPNDVPGFAQAVAGHVALAGWRPEQ